MQIRVTRRRALARVVASLVVISTPRFAFGQPDKADSGKAEAGKLTNSEKDNNGTGKKGKSAVLTVLVTGNDQPIGQAEVKLKFPPSVGGESTRSTDETGETTFNSAGTGTAKVRVIVSGWESSFQDVILKEGPQRLTIKLKPLPNAK